MMKLNLILVLLMMLSLIACKDKQANDKDVVIESTNPTENSTEQSKLQKKTILCFGNSLTAGYGLDENEAWPALLQERIDSLNLDYQVVNAGLSGETSAGGLGRIDWVLTQPVDIFILELGANDMLRGLSVSETEKNLVKIVEAVKADNPDAKIVTAGLLSPPNMGPAYELAFNAMYPKISEKFLGANIPFLLQNVAQIDSLNLPDGKHPNKNGQRKVLDNVWEVLKSLL